MVFSKGNLELIPIDTGQDQRDRTVVTLPLKLNQILDYIIWTVLSFCFHYELSLIHDHVTDLISLKHV